MPLCSGVTPGEPCSAWLLCGKDEAVLTWLASVQLAGCNLQQAAGHSSEEAAGCAPMRPRSCTAATRCLEDLTSTTRYVTWSLHTKSSTAMTAMLRRVRRLPSIVFFLPLCQ